MGNLEGLHHWECHCCCRKSHKCHQAWNNKFLLEKTVARCCTWLHRTCDRGHHERDWKKVDMAKKVGAEGWYGPWRISRANGHHTRERTEDDLREVSVSELVPDDEEEDLEETAPGTRRGLISQDCSWLLLHMDSSMMQALKRSRLWKRDWYCRKTFLEKWKSKKVKQKSWCISIKLHGVCRVSCLPSHLSHRCHPCSSKLAPPLPPSARCETREDAGHSNEPLPASD